MSRLLFALWLLLVATLSQARPLIACGHPIYPPVSWASAGQLVGVAPAVVSRLFTELGYQVQLDVLGNWKRCLLEVQQGHADIVVSAYRTAERERIFAFTDEYVVADPIALFINRARPLRFEHWDELKGKTVGLLLGDSFGDRFDRFAARHLRVERVSKGGQNFTKLVLGRIDFMPIGLYSGRLQVQRLGYQEVIAALPRILLTEHYYIAVNRHSPLVRQLPYLNHRLRELRADGTLERLTQHYSQRYLQQARP